MVLFVFVLKGYLNTTNEKPDFVVVVVSFGT